MYIILSHPRKRIDGQAALMEGEKYYGFNFDCG